MIAFLNSVFFWIIIKWAIFLFEDGKYLGIYYSCRPLFWFDRKKTAKICERLRSDDQRLRTLFMQ